MSESQADIMLKALQVAGSRGVHTFEMRAQFMGNPSQRRAELEERGYTIAVTRERLTADGAMGARYRLVEPKPTPIDPVVDPVVEEAEGALFEMKPHQPAFDSMITWDDEAA